MFSAEKFCESPSQPSLLEERATQPAVGVGGTNGAEESEPTSASTATSNNVSHDIIRDLIDREGPRMCRPRAVPQVKAEMFAQRSAAEMLPPIRLVHPKFGGQASFKTFREAALCILLMDGAPLLDFVRWASEMKAQIKRDPACVPRNEFWRYFLLHDPSIPGDVKPPRTSASSDNSENERSANAPNVKKIRLAGNPGPGRTVPPPPGDGGGLLSEDPSPSDNLLDAAHSGTRGGSGKGGMSGDPNYSDSDTEGDAIGRGRKRRQMRRPNKGGHSSSQQ